MTRANATSLLTDLTVAGYKNLVLVTNDGGVTFGVTVSGAVAGVDISAAVTKYGCTVEAQETRFA